MNLFSTVPLSKGLVVCLLVLSAALSHGQMTKEERNHYPQVQKIQKIEIFVRKPIYIFSPYLSYKEQKKIQMARKKIGGITFSVESSRKNGANGHLSSNYKRPHSLSKSKKLPPEKTTTAEVDTAKPFVRYEFPDSTRK